MIHFHELMKVLVVLYLFCAASPSQAAETFNADQLLARAVARNAELKAYDLDAQSQFERASQAKLWDDPNLDLGFENRHQPGLGGTDSGRIGLSQFVNRPGRLAARNESAHATYRGTRLEYETAKIRLEGTLIKLIYAYKISIERTHHAKERVGRIATVNTYLSSRPFIAPQTKAQVVIVKSKLSILQKQLRESEAERSAAWDNLNLYLGFDSEPIVDLKWFRQPRAFDRSEFLLKVESKNPDLRRTAVLLEVTEADAKLAELEAWPGVTISGQYANGGGYQPERVYGLGLSFPIPLLNGNRAGIRASAYAAQAAKARVDWERSKLKHVVNATFAKYDAAAASLRVLSLEDIAKSDLEMVEIDRSFKRGQVDLITYLEADQQHFDNFNASLLVQAEYLESLSDLLYFIGEAPITSEL